MNRSEHEKNITPIQIDTTNNHINTELVETFSPESLYQQYQTYTKINDCVQDIQHIFTKKNLSKQEYNKQITNKISDMLTDRESYHQLYDLHQGNISSIKQTYTKQDQWYKNMIQSISEWTKTSDIQWESNPAWYSLNTTPESNHQGPNHKIYTTINTQAYHFIQKLPNLAITLRKIGLENNDKIQLKVPSILIGFLKHNDSLVIHFKNQENKQKIQQAIDTWIQTNNISIDKRELERTTYATDSYDTSFTQLIAQNIATRIFDMHKKNKYADNIIIQQGIGYAIKQSQNPPSIIHKK